MSFAWATAALLVLLFPGFFFFAGAALPERFTRDDTPGSPASQLAAILFVSLVVQVVFLWLFRDQIDMHAVLTLLQLEGPDPVPLATLSEVITRSVGPTLAYVLGTCISGLGLGWLWSTAAVKVPWFRGYLKHGWVLDLQPNDSGLVYAFVLSRVRQDERILMYRGTVESFSLNRDGTFAYLTLAAPSRYYMHLKDEKSVTADDWAEIGATKGTRADSSYLVLSGDQIDNVVFESYPFSPPTKDRVDVAASQADNWRQILEILEADESEPGKKKRPEE